MCVFVSGMPMCVFMSNIVHVRRIKFLYSSIHTFKNILRTASYKVHSNIIFSMNRYDPKFLLAIKSTRWKKP